MSLFGAKPAVEGEKTAPAAPSGGLFGASGGGLFGAKPAVSAPATADASKVTTPAAMTPAAGGLFGNLNATKPAEAPKVAGGFSFGAKPADGAAASTGAAGSSTAPAAPATGSLFNSKAATPAPGAATPAATASMVGSGAATPALTKPPTPAPAAATAPTEPAPSLLRGKTLEDIVDTWTKDLDLQVKEFEKQAGEAREWDKVLVRNGNQVCPPPPPSPD